MLQSHAEEDLRALETHAHACSLYSDDAEQTFQFVPYLQTGLLLGEQCVYFIDRNSREFILKAMQTSDFDLNPYLGSGAFKIVSVVDVAKAMGSFSAAKMITYWSTLLSSSETEGFAALRVAGEMTWALQSEFNLKALAAYESQLNKFATDKNVSFLCQYHRQDFSASSLKDVVSIHPVIVDGDKVLDNPTHIRTKDFNPDSADAYLQATLDTLAMSKMLRQTNMELVTSIAEQKRLQKELVRLDKERQDRETVEAEKQHYRMIAETIPQVVWTATADGKCDYFNPYWYRYTGMMQKNALPDGWANTIHPDDREVMIEVWRRCVRTGENFKKEFRFRASDGSYSWYLSRALPMKDRQGNIVEWFGVCVDIHEHKTLSQTLTAQRDKAEEATRSKSIFLANMSHEIRTPMNAIIGMCNILLKTRLDETQYQYADNIREGANSLLSVINDILDFSKVEAGKIDLDVTEFSLADLVEHTCGFLSPTARSKSLMMMSHIDGAIPERVNGDPEKIRQILVNLASNAMKFSDHGEIVLRADLESKSNNNLCIKFSVSDQGIGMSSEVQSKLFKPFTQADPSIASKFGGSGLGLSICKSLVELMKGDIGIESAPGKGATIWFRVPLQTATNAQPKQMPVVKPTSPVVTAIDCKPMRSETILIVEDYAINQQVAKLYLCDLGFSSEVAINGREGVEKFKKGDYDLILMDCSMPEMDGFAATTLIRQHETITGKHTPIIAMTAHAMGGDRERCLSGGYDDYMSKPVDPEKLKQMLEKYLPASMQGAAPDIKPISLDIVQSRYGEISERLLKMFFANAPKDVRNLKTTFDGPDRNNFIHTVHGFKGVCSTVFAGKMKDTCVTIESAARESDWSSIPGLLQRLEDETAEMQEFLKCNLTGLNK